MTDKFRFRVCVCLAFATLTGVTMLAGAQEEEGSQNPFARGFDQIRSAFKPSSGPIARPMDHRAGSKFSGNSTPATSSRRVVPKQQPAADTEDEGVSAPSARTPAQVPADPFNNMVRGPTPPNQPRPSTTANSTRDKQKQSPQTAGKNGRAPSAPQVAPPRATASSRRDASVGEKQAAAAGTASKSALSDKPEVISSPSSQPASKLAAKTAPAEEPAESEPLPPPLKDDTLPAGDLVDADASPSAPEEPKLRVESMGPRSIALNMPASYTVGVYNDSDVEAEHVNVTIRVPAWAEIVNTRSESALSRNVTRNAAGGLLWEVERVKPRGSIELKLQIVPRERRGFELAVDWTCAPPAPKVADSSRRPGRSPMLLSEQEPPKPISSRRRPTGSTVGNSVAAKPEPSSAPSAGVEDVATVSDRDGAKPPLPLLAESNSKPAETTDIFAPPQPAATKSAELTLPAAPTNLAMPSDPPLPFESPLPELSASPKLENFAEVLPPPKAHSEVELAPLPLPIAKPTPVAESLPKIIEGPATPAPRTATAATQPSTLPSTDELLLPPANKFGPPALAGVPTPVVPPKAPSPSSFAPSPLPAESPTLAPPTAAFAAPALPPAAVAAAPLDAPLPEPAAAPAVRDPFAVPAPAAPLTNRFAAPAAPIASLTPTAKPATPNEITAPAPAALPRPEPSQFAAKSTPAAAPPKELSPAPATTLMPLPSPLRPQQRKKEPKIELAIAGPTEVKFGEESVFTLTVKNAGDADAEKVELRLLPTPVGGEPIATHSLGTVRAGETQTAEIELVADEPGKLTIYAEALALGNHRSIGDKIVQVISSDLKIDIRGPDKEAIGAETAYQICVTNEGAATLQNIKVTIALPPTAKVDELTGADRRLSTKPDRMIVVLNTLEASEERVIELKCAFELAGEQKLQATAEAGQLKHTGSFATVISGAPDLVMEIVPPKGQIPVRSVAKYEIVIRNRGTGVAEGFQVAAFFSEGIEPVSASGAGHQVARGQVVFHRVPKIAPGDELVLTINAAAQQPGRHRFRAELHAKSHEIALAEETTTRFDDIRQTVAEQPSRFARPKR